MPLIATRPDSPSVAVMLEIRGGVLISSACGGDMKYTTCLRNCQLTRVFCGDLLPETGIFMRNDRIEALLLQMIPP